MSSGAVLLQKMRKSSSRNTVNMPKENGSAERRCRQTIPTKIKLEKEIKGD